MFKQSSSHSSSSRAVCQSLFLTAAIVTQSLALPTLGAAFEPPSGKEIAKTPPTETQPELPAPQVFPPLTSVTQQPNAPQAAVIVATNRDSFPDHSNGSKAIQGDTITYTAAITNTGDANATSVVYASTIDQNTSTLVGGSPTIQFTVTGDTYSAVGNMRIDSNTIVGPGQHVQDNDTLNGATLTGFGPTKTNATTVPNGSTSITTSNNGTVVMNADGSFTYNPAAGFGGAGVTDSFWYTLTKNTPGTNFPNGFPSGAARVTDQRLRASLVYQQQRRGLLLELRWPLNESLSDAGRLSGSQRWRRKSS